MQRMQRTGRKDLKEVKSLTLLPENNSTGNPCLKLASCLRGNLEGLLINETFLFPFLTHSQFRSLRILPGLESVLITNCYRV